MKKIKGKAVLKYSVFFLIILLLSLAKTKHGLSPFALGFFAALVFSRQNLAAIAPAYVAAALIASFSLNSLIIAIAPVVVLTATYFIFFKLKRAVTMTAVNIAVLLSQVPFIIFNINSPITMVLSVLIAQVFAYTSIIITYALLVRGFKYRLTADELASGAALLGALSLGLYGLSINSVNLFFGAAAFVLLAAVKFLNGGSALITAAVMGIGAAFSKGEIAVCAALVCWSASAILFKKTSLILSAAAILITDALLGYYFSAYGTYGYANLLAVAAGLVLFLAIPNKYKYLLSGAVVMGDGSAGKTIVNRDRMYVSNRLYSLSEIFKDMQSELEQEITVKEPTEISVKRLSKDVCISYCGVCPEGENCCRALGGDTSVVLENIIEGTLAKGRVSLLDMPPFITSRCRRMNGLVSVINESLDKHKSKEKISESVDVGKHMLAGQMGGTAELMANLAADLKKSVSFNSDREKLIIDELSYHNIVCSEAVVYGEKDVKVTVIVREQDADKKILPRIISKAVGSSLVREGGVDYIGDKAGVHLTAAPRYDLLIGEAYRGKDGNEICGDVRGMQRIGVDRAMVALCDGMGSGSSAAKSSSAAIAMIENFYRAGFNNNVILSLVNKMLSMKNEENFSSLDMCVIDLKNGGADIIKMGATEGYLKRKNNIEIIESRALPMGIIEDASPTVERKVLFNGDLLILVSDGVTDALGREGMLELISSEKTVNPQTLADIIIENAVKRGAEDDVTALCVRVYNK